MVTSISTGTDNNISDVACNQRYVLFDYHHYHLLLFFRSTQTYQPTPVVSSKYHCLLRTPLLATIVSCNCNSIIVNNSQAVILFSVVQVNSRQESFAKTPGALPNASPLPNFSSSKLYCQRCQRRSGYCGSLLTSKNTNCFFNNLNSSQEKENEHIVGSFVPVI